MFSSKFYPVKFPLSLGLFLLLGACSNANFTNGAAATTASQSTGTSTPTTTAPGTTSTTPACVPVADITRLTKILFLVDTSGSNAVWIDPTTGNQCSSANNVGCVPPTDPSKTFRLGSIQKFLNQYGSMSNLQWGFITFSAEAAQNYIAPNGGNSFTGSAQVMQTALNSFAQSSDSGDTPYGLAIDAVTSAIAEDPDHNTASNPQYYVVMLTDGYPSDFTGLAAAMPFISDALNAAPKEVSFSTIFYGTQNVPSSVAAISLLSGMAALGGGQFANVNNPATGINIDAVIPGHSCP